MAAIQLNGSPFSPSTIDVDHEKIGTSIQAANGARRWAHRADKRRWIVRWNLVPLATLTAVRAIFALTTSFTYQDENGATATVFCEANALQSNIALLASEGGAQVLYYDISLTLTEA